MGERENPLERWPGYDEQSWQQRFFELDRRYSKLGAYYHHSMLAALSRHQDQGHD